MSGVVTAADPEHRAYEKFVEEEIFSPLGMSSCSIGVDLSSDKGFLGQRSWAVSLFQGLENLCFDSQRLCTATAFGMIWNIQALRA